jgi:hypothetical protein
MPAKSPNYPSIGLAEALEKIADIYGKFGRSAVTPEEAVKSWGHKGLHGPALAELSALKKFGLIQSLGKNGVTLTDSGISLVLGDKDSQEYKEAIQNAALCPKIFREIFEREKPGVISDGVLKLYLVKNKEFTETGTDKFIKSYRETIALANLNGIQDNRLEDGVEEKGVPDLNGQTAISDPKTRIPSGVPDRNTTQQTKLRSYSWALSGDFNAKLDLLGEAKTEEDLDALADYVEITIKALKRSLKAKQEEEKNV